MRYVKSSLPKSLPLFVYKLRISHDLCLSILFSIGLGARHVHLSAFVVAMSTWGAISSVRPLPLPLSSQEKTS